MSSGSHDPIDLNDLPHVVALWPTAGRAWGLSRSTTYLLAARGEFPTRVIKLGRRYCVVTAELRASLGMSDDH
jgi:predicted DNA-binding transcriptional regulator AlpA